MYFVFTFCVMVSSKPANFQGNMTNCWGWGTCYGSAAHPGGSSDTPKSPHTTGTVLLH